MNENESRLYFAADIRAIERYLIDTLNTPGYELMLRAGEAVADRCRQLLPKRGRVLILCGPGNNAGDGYVVAKSLKQSGYVIELISLCDPDDLSGDAETAKNDWLSAQGDIRAFTGELPQQSDLIVDALLGTGLQRPLKASYRVVVQLCNEDPAPVVAVDIPSGLNSETGMPAGSAVIADYCETFIGLKLGLYNGMAANYCGEISLHDLDTPAQAYTQVSPRVTRLQADWLSQLLPPRKAVCHKGDFGHALIVGGDVGMSGAVRMAAEAAARSGAGLVTVATAPQHAELVNMAFPVAITRAVEGFQALASLLSQATVVGAGPGLGRSEWSRDCWRALQAVSKPMVVDADGLNQLARAPQKQSHWILTPHPGEAARLLGISTEAVQQDRLAVVSRLQQLYGGVIVLKGRGTLVANEDRVYLCDGGNPGMASAGMGDVLTGVISGLLAQGLTLTDAALAGVLAHAAAADLAANGNFRGLTAMDLMPWIPEVVNP